MSTDTLTDFHPAGQFGAVIGEHGVTFDAIELLHRPEPGDASFVTFHMITSDRRGPHDTGFRNVASIDRWELDSLLPFAREHLHENAYHSLNGFYRAGMEWETVRGRRVHRRVFAPGLLPTYRANDGTRYLNGCYVDLDCHSVERTPGQALGTAFDLQLAGRIPDVSVFWFSGRGLWLLWLLRDEKAAAPAPDDPHVLPPSQRAWPEMQDLYRRTEHAIVAMPELLALGSDTGATDAARVMRLAGSLNTKAGQPVRVLPQLVNGRVPTYTVRELAAWWNVQVPPPIQRALTTPPVLTPTTPRRTIARRDPNRPKNPALQAAARRRWQYALADFEALRDLRGGRFTSGTRETACFVFALLLRRNRIGPDALDAQVFTLAAASGLELAEARHAIDKSGSYRTSNPSSRWFSYQLHVTPAEAMKLEKWPAVGEQPDAPAILTRTTEARRAEMLRQVGALGYCPTVRVMTAYLTSKGFPISVAAVHADYRKFGFDSRHRGGRPPRLPLA